MILEDWSHKSKGKKKNQKTDEKVRERSQDYEIKVQNMLKEK